MVHVFVSGAVDGAFGGELEGVEERVTLDAEGAVQLQQGVADPTGPVVHQLQSENRKSSVCKVLKNFWTTAAASDFPPVLKNSYLTYFFNPQIAWSPV